MTKLTVNLNKAASELCGTATKVRVRVTNGALQILPTDRKIPKGLPKGEILIDLREKKQAVRALRFSLPSELADGVFAQEGNCFEIRTAKHHWMTLVGCDKPVLIPGKPQPAGGSVSSK